MIYRVQLASFAVHAKDIGPIPRTEQTIELDTDKGMGREIWWGYLQMREEQKQQAIARPGQKAKSTRPNADPYEVKQPSSAPEIDKFKEAVDLFFRFMAGEGRDNFKQVVSLTVVTPEIAVEEPDSLSI